MFDIGASELFVIGVVALIVIGPERLPRVAKTLGNLFGRLQRYVSEVKSDINREIELEELRALKTTMQDAARTIQQSVTSQVNYIDSEVKQAGAQVQEQIESAQKQVESAVAPITGIQLMPPVTPVSEAAPASTENATPDKPSAADSLSDKPPSNDKPA
jgi:sec-independent protein translocase protein TatB